MPEENEVTRRRILVETATVDTDTGQLTDYRRQTRRKWWEERAEKWGLAAKAAVGGVLVGFGLGFLVGEAVNRPKTEDTRPKHQIEDRWEPGRPGYPREMPWPTITTPPKPIPVEEPRTDIKPAGDLVPVAPNERPLQTSQREPINIMDLPPAPPQTTTTPRKKDQLRQ